jgi:hypothetical protein
MIRLICIAASLSFLISASAQNYPNGNQSDSIPAGTQIRVRTNQEIDAHDRADNRVYTGTIDRDHRPGRYGAEWDRDHPARLQYGADRK